MIEGLLTFFLVCVVFATNVAPNGAFAQIAGLAIGLTITLDMLMGAGLTGGILNPARSIGPELASGVTGRTSTDLDRGAARRRRPGCASLQHAVPETN